ncbi:hypothetical protein AGMMS49992_23640 [Clostridia bacterium]|nr:hypothetical protein AGMMS49992_23640 [Clostridia bacterium]
MRKTLGILFLILALLVGMCSGALAVQSKTGEDNKGEAVIATPGVTEKGSELPQGVSQEEWPSWRVFFYKEHPLVARELLNIGRFMQDKELPVVRYFSESIQNQTRNLLPANYNIDILKLYEFSPIGDEGYLEKFGDVDVFFTFQTNYPLKTNVVALVGVILNEKPIAYPDYQDVKWYALQAAVVESTIAGETHLKIRFTKELLLQMLNYEVHPVVLGIVSDPLN